MDAPDRDLQAGVEARPFEGGALLELSGTVDVSCAARLHEEALRLAALGGTVILDWSGCTHLDAAALQIVLALKRRLEAGGGSIRVGHDAPEIREWLTIAGASALLPEPGGREPAANTRRL